MNKVKFLAPIILCAALLAGCGGGGGSASPQSNDVATAGTVHITKAQFTALMDQAKRSFAQQGRQFPKQGTTEYETIKSQAVTLLIQQAERAAKANEMGIKISDKDIQQRLDQIKKQYFGGSEKRYQAELKKQCVTDAEVRSDVGANVLSDEIYKKVTTGAKVSDTEVKAYYDSHTSVYTQPETRVVRHILVKDKALADKLYSQLKGGADFAALAKKYSQDPGSKAQGGELTISRGQTVPQFDKVAFQLKTGELSKPVKTQFGWHIIQAQKDATKSKTTPFKQVKGAIRQQLLQTKRSSELQKWLDGVKKEYASKVSYATGLAPPATSTSATTTG